MKVVVVGGGIAGLAAARRLEALAPHAAITLLERSERLGGKLLTEREDGFIVEGGADSFLARKPRGIGLCEELGLANDLIERRLENTNSFVRIGDDLHALPKGLTGLVPTDLSALETSALLSAEGKRRLAEEPTIPAANEGDESISSFVRRRLGPEAYDRLVEPLLTGIYGGDGEQLSLAASFPNLSAIEREHGSLLRGLQMQPLAETRPVFLSLRNGIQTLIDRLAESLERTVIRKRWVVDRLDRRDGGYVVSNRPSQIHADAVVLAVPAFAVAKVVSGLDPALASIHSEIPYTSSAIVSLGYRSEEVVHPLAGYGYVVPQSEHSRVLACTWSSSKWTHRAPAGSVLMRVYAGRFGEPDVTRMTNDDLYALARAEIRFLGIDVEPSLARIHRWRLGMPQYVLGHPERLERIDALVSDHPGLALAGAAYRGVGIPDCIASGEAAAESVVRSLAATPA